jgi:hypothetical protein
VPIFVSLFIVFKSGVLKNISLLFYISFFIRMFAFQNPTLASANDCLMLDCNRY